MNNHQKSIFYPSRGHYKEHQLGNFLNSALALLGLGLRKLPIWQKLNFANHPYLCKGLILIIILLVSNFSFAEKMPILSGIGGNFSAISSATGKEIKFSDFKGKVVILAFGYTNCSDICPFTMGYLQHLYTKLTAKEKQQTRVIFTTIDPEYDTPKHLKEFLQNFNEDFIGLSGSKQMIKKITSLFQAEYSKLAETSVPTEYIRRVNQKTFENEVDKKADKASLFSHTVIIYLIDKMGNTRSLEYTGTATKKFIKKIQVLINE